MGPPDDDATIAHPLSRARPPPCWHNAVQRIRQVAQRKIRTMRTVLPCNRLERVYYFPKFALNKRYGLARKHTCNRMPGKRKDNSQ